MIYTVYALVGRIIITLLYVMKMLMFGRALMSWFAQDEDSKLAKFLFAATEPFVYPIRKFLSKFEFFNNMPIDMSFLAAMMILIICTSFLNSTLM